MSTKRILVVDDEPDFVALVKKNLEQEGYAVEVAYNGVEAIQKVKANPPDAMVLDVMMPEMDGFEVCTELRKDDQYEDIPIILLTAVSDHVSSSQYSHSDAMNADADDYLSKPASPDDIIRSLKMQLD